MICILMLTSFISAFGADRTINGNEVTITIDETGGTGVFTIQETVIGVTITSFPSVCGLVGNVLTCDYETGDPAIVYQTSGSGSVSGIIVGGFPSTQQTITGDTQIGAEGSPTIKINEFESNPTGTDAGNEWLELYNPNAFSVDVTGWKIVDIGNEETVLSGVISAGGYLVISEPTYALSIINSNEMLTLKDSSNNVIDTTDILSDEANDDNSWQRVPDGNSNWEFKALTQGATNDGEDEEENNGGEAVDDLMVNYIRGKIIVDGDDAVAGFSYTIEVLSGANAGFTFTNTVDANIPSSLLGNGYYDTQDHIEFSTGESFKVSATDFSECFATGIFANGGNGDLDAQTSLINLNCEIPNIAPVLEPIGNKNVDENELLQFTINANDANGDSLTYENSTVLPSGATFNTGTKTFSWTPTFSQSGSYQVTFTVTDVEFEDSETITIIVNNLNQVPEFDGPIPDQNWNEDTNSQIDLSNYFSDADGDNLDYSVLGNSSIEINIVNGIATLIPNLNWFGTENVVFTASDGTDDVDSNSVELNVNSVNDAPVLNNIANKIVNEGQIVEILATASDVDENDVLTFDMNNNPGFENNGDGDFTWQTDYTDSGIYSVNVIVNDNNGGSDSQIVQVTVNDINQPPVMDPVDDDNVIDIEEDSGLNSPYDLTATDDNNAVDRFEVSQENTNQVNCDITDMILGVTPALNFQGVATCKIKVYDSQNAFDETTVTINVQDVNDAPEITSSSPSFNPLIAEDGSKKFSIVWSDIDNVIADVVVKWFKDGIQVGADNNNYNSEYTFVGDGSVGEFEIKVEVDDGPEIATKSWTLKTSDIPIADTFDGNTTDFTGMNDNDLSSVLLVLEKTAFGRIEFIDPVDMTDVVDLDTYAEIKQNLAGIDSNVYNSFKNKRARIILYNIDDPDLVIYHDNNFNLNYDTIFQLCQTSICSNLTYSDVKNEISFEVSSFSTFKAGDKLSCSALGGNICSVGYICPGDSLDAGDTNSCCALTCIKEPPKFTDIKNRCEVINTNLDVSITEPDDGDEFEVHEEIKTEVKIENNHNEDLDVDLEIYFYDLDEDEVIDDTDDSIDVDEGDSEKLEFTFNIPNDVKDGDYAVFVIAEGKNGVELCNEDFVLIDITREKADLIIKNIDVYPQKVAPGKGVEFNVEIENIGTKEQENIYVEIENAELELSGKSEEFNIEEFDEDDSKEVNLFLKIPSDAEEGEYNFKITVVFDDGNKEVSDSKIITVAKEPVKQGGLISLGGQLIQLGQPSDNVGANTITLVKTQPKQVTVVTQVSREELFFSLDLTEEEIIMVIIIMLIIGILIEVVLMRNIIYRR